MELKRHDLAKDPPSREFLERWVDEDRLEDFLNRRSPAFKEMNLGERTLTKKQAIDLMLQEPNLIRRPIVVEKGRVVFGYDPEAWDQLRR